MFHDDDDCSKGAWETRVFSLRPKMVQRTTDHRPSLATPKRAALLVLQEQLKDFLDGKLATVTWTTGRLT